MKEKKNVRLYNLLFPVWLLVWFPTPAWLVLIPLNYLIDLLVLRLSLRGMEGAKKFAGDYNWLVCLNGFLADFAGAAALLVFMLLTDSIGTEAAEAIGPALNMDPFRNVWALLLTLLAISIAGVLIFLLDRRTLVKCGLERERAERSAKLLAVFTAPYLFLFPSAILYSVIGS